MAALIVLAVVCAAQLGLVAWLITTRDRQAAMDAIRFSALASDAMEHLKAASLTEKVQASAVRKQYDTQLAYLADQLQRQSEMAKGPAIAPQTPEQPRWVTTDTGDKIDLNKWEVM